MPRALMVIYWGLLCAAPGGLWGFSLEVPSGARYRLAAGPHVFETLTIYGTLELEGDTVVQVTGNPFAPAEPALVINKGMILGSGAAGERGEDGSDGEPGTDGVIVGSAKDLDKVRAGTRGSDATAGGAGARLKLVVSGNALLNEGFIFLDGGLIEIKTTTLEYNHAPIGEPLVPGAAAGLGGRDNSTGVRTNSGSPGHVLISLTPPVLVPEIQVSDGERLIQNGEGPLGLTPVGNEPLASHTYTVRNLGTAPLRITALSAPPASPSRKDWTNTSWRVAMRIPSRSLKRPPTPP